MASAFQKSTERSTRPGGPYARAHAAERRVANDSSDERESANSRSSDPGGNPGPTATARMAISAAGEAHVHFARFGPGMNPRPGSDEFSQHMVRADLYFSRLLCQASRVPLLVHVHSRHGGVIHVVVSFLIVGGPDFLWIGLVGIHVDHPTKDMRMEFAACGLARFFGVNRTE